MTTITIKVNNRTKKGKYLLYLISRLAENNHIIQIEKIPNNVTLKAIKDANDGIGKEYTDIDELFRELEL